MSIKKKQAQMLADLEKSGLDKGTISEMGCKPIESKEELVKTLGFSSIEGQSIIQACVCCYSIPYPGGGDFTRVKLLPPLNSAKYLSPRGSDGKQFYFLRSTNEKKPTGIIITEGEKKTALLTQLLREEKTTAAIGVPGVWMFPDDLKMARGKTVFLAYDSDFKEKIDVQQALASLIIKVSLANGTPKVVVWDKEKGKGIDDYLVAFDANARGNELSRLIADAELQENPFSLFNLLNAEMLANACAKAGMHKSAVGALFAKFEFKKLFSTTKSDFFSFFDACVAEKQKRKTTTGWLEYAKNGQSIIFPGPCAVDFFSRKGGNLLYCSENFWEWSGKHWQAQEDIDQKAQIQALIAGVEQKAARKSIVEDVFFQVKNLAYKPKIELDGNKSLIALQNGVLDLDSTSLLDHKREYFQTILLPFFFDRSAECARWREFLKEVFRQEDYLDSGSVECRLQEWFGYCLVPSAKLEKCLYLWGEGANGKSVFLKTLAALLGEENASSIEPKSLFDRFQMVGLRGKLVNICTDIDTKTVFSEEFKKIVSGEACTVDVKFKSHMTFSPFARHLFSANDLVATRDRSHGFFRRFDVIEFRSHFAESKRDEALLEKLVLELPGVFNWALEGLNRLRENNWKMTYSADFEETKKKFEEESNPVSLFVLDCCRAASASESTATSIRSHYLSFCTEKGYSPLNDVHLGRELNRLGFAKERRTNEQKEREYYYKGLEIAKFIH